MTDKTDVIVVGAGIVGLFTAYELADRGLDAIVLEKNEAPGLEATSRNAGVIHVIQPPFNSLKSKLCIQGNTLYHSLDEELGLGIKWVKAYLASTRKLQRPLAEIAAWYLRRNLPSTYSVRVVGLSNMRDVEPLVSRSVSYAIEVDGYGVVHPASLASRIAEIVEESASISYSDPAESIEVREDSIIVESARGSYKAKLLVNSAGLYADEIARLVGDSYKIIPVKGVMTVYDSVKVDSIIAWLQLKTSYETKGGGIIPHPRGVLLGPTYSGVADKGDTSYSKRDITTLLERFQPLLDRPIEGQPEVIVGLRATSERRDFTIEYSSRSKRIIHLIGIESPGLTAAPAIAKRVASMMRGVLPP